MAGNAALWRFERTTGVDTTGNRIITNVPDAPCRPRELLGAAFDSLVASLPGIRPEIPTSAAARRPRSAILVDEWGPYDGLSPKLWPVDTARAPVRLRVLGPPGHWRVTRRIGVAALSSDEGTVGDTLVVTPSASMIGDWRIELEYLGEATVSPRGQRLRMDWTVRFFTWADSAGDPAQNPRGFEDMMEGLPSFTRREARVDYVWYRPLIAELPQERWALEATTSVTLPSGEYSLRTISDDGVRVWVDGELVVDHWGAHGSAIDYARLTGGRRELRVRYYQLDGWAEIRVEIVRGSGRSTGSSGPH
jgi:hypothetical protein